MNAVLYGVATLLALNLLSWPLVLVGVWEPELHQERIWLPIISFFEWVTGGNLWFELPMVRSLQ